MPVVLYPESRYPDDSVERAVFGPGVTVRIREAKAIANLPDADCADVDGLMILRHHVSGADMARFPRLKTIVRMGVGYDRLDREAAAARGITICNVPDYGTTEVADHAVALAVALRRGLFLHHAIQGRSPPGPWAHVASPLIRRFGVQTFGVLGLGRIGTAAALRARGFGFRVVFFDPYLPIGAELALGFSRVRSLAELLRQADVLSVHTPLTRETRGMLGAAELMLLPKNAVVVSTARGPIIDIDALYDALKSGHIAGAGLDVIPVEPPPEPAPALLRAYRAQEDWLVGRVVITPHAAFYSPDAWDDTRRLAAETMAAALAGKPQNVIPPDMY